MSCYNPLRAVQGADPLTGEARVSFDPRSRLLSARAIEVPCGQCIGCRIARARSWATRCLHESRLYTENAFVTLTYAPDKVPAGLVVRDLQLFLKRLRYYSGRQFRYYAVGEYGEKLSRPHYHVLLFGFDFADKKHWKGRGDRRLYRSELLEKAWPLGHALTGTLTSESAQYVAKYSVKVVRGREAVAYYGSRRPPFAVMSRRPGIGAGWIDKYCADVLPRDFVVVPGGRRVAVPAYYLNRQPVALQEVVKEARVVRNTPEDPYLALERRPAVARYMELREKHFDERRVRDEDASLRGV